MKHTECEDCKLRKGDCGYHFNMDGKTNYNIASLSACDQYGNCMFFKPKAKLQGDLISREDLKKHKFLIPDIQFVSGRSNGKTIEKITLAYHKDWNDAIDAIYENAPTIEPRIEYGTDGQPYRLSISGGQVVPDALQGWRYEVERPTGVWGKWVISEIRCPNCLEYFQTDCYSMEELKKCPNCGAQMKEADND